MHLSIRAPLLILEYHVKEHQLEQQKQHQLNPDDQPVGHIFLKGLEVVDLLPDVQDQEHAGVDDAVTDQDPVEHTDGDNAEDQDQDEAGQGVPIDTDKVEDTDLAVEETEEEP